jgi:hypothetical protein
MNLSEANLERHFKETAEKMVDNVVSKVKGLSIQNDGTESDEICPLATTAPMMDQSYSSASKRLALCLKRRMLKTQLCQYYKNGNCAYGDKCGYAHGESELRQKPKANEIPEEFKLRHGTKVKVDKVCFRYLEGFCPFGTECHFKHEKMMKLQEEEKTMERKKEIGHLKKKTPPYGIKSREDIMSEIAEYEARMGYRDDYFFHRQQRLRRAMEARRSRMMPPVSKQYPSYRSLDSPAREYRMNPIAREFKPRQY